jgi:riboflavin transporter FmnP
MTNVKRLIVTAMLTALCIILPMAFHSIPMAGHILLPMHVPVLLAGLICGWKFGLIAGVAAPLLSSSITGMPPAAIVPLMMIELGTYGLVAGLVLQYVRTKRSSVDLYIGLISALLAGRVVAGAAQFAYFYKGEFIDGVLMEQSYTLGLWVGAYFVTSFPGLVIQLAFVPSVVMALERERVIPLRYPINA